MLEPAAANDEATAPASPSGVAAGTRVRVTDRLETRHGQEGVVQSSVQQMGGVRIGVRFEDGHRLEFGHQQLRVLDVTRPDEVRWLRVGLRVRVLDRGSARASVLVGQEAVVLSIFSNGDRVRVRMVGSGQEVSLDGNDVERASAGG